MNRHIRFVHPLCSEIKSKETKIDVKIPNKKLSAMFFMTPCMLYGRYGDCFVVDFHVIKTVEIWEFQVA